MKRLSILVAGACMLFAAVGSAASTNLAQASEEYVPYSPDFYGVAMEFTLEAYDVDHYEACTFVELTLTADEYTALPEMVTVYPDVVLTVEERCNSPGGERYKRYL